MKWKSCVIVSQDPFFTFSNKYRKGAELGMGVFFLQTSLNRLLKFKKKNDWKEGVICIWLNKAFINPKNVYFAFSLV